MGEVPGPQAPRADGEHPADGPGEAQGTIEVYVRDGVVWCRWPNGQEERMGKGYVEIAQWWRNVLARDLGLPSSDDPRYNEAVERIFGGTE